MESATAPEPKAPDRSPLRAALKTARPTEWVKNVLVFAGVIFSGQLDDTWAIGQALITFGCFCAISSAGYFINDLNDVELDRQHPKKRFRPIAAGQLKIGTAWVISVCLALGAIAAAFALVNWKVGLFVIGYGIIQVAYSFGLKQVVIIDVMTLATLFIFRVMAGAEAVDAHASEWLILCTGMLACFLGFTKRRQEAVSELHEGTSSRPVLEHYSLPFLDQITFEIGQEPIVALLRLQNGEVDIPGDGIPPAKFTEVMGDPAQAARVVQGGQLHTGYITLNVTIPTFDNPDVRKAVNMAIDKKALLTNVWNGKGMVLGSMAVPTDRR